MQYTDPGSGALLWQMLAVGAVGAMFYFRKALGFFRRNSQTAEKTGSGGVAQPKSK